VERQQAKAARRRPVRIEFCEGDVLALFDDWRRAVGVVQSTGEAQTAPRKAPLAAHLERVTARLVGRRTQRSPRFELEVVRLLSEIDPLAADSRQARGEARAAIVDRLETLDRELIAAAIADLDEASAATLRREAEEELAGLGPRMPGDARARAVDAAFQRLVRESLSLPIVRYG
jgi:hypothetical protein